MRVVALMFIIGCGTSHGDLQQGATCDPQNDQCADKLKCCAEPTHMPDASSYVSCVPSTDNTCPLYP